MVENVSGERGVPLTRTGSQASPDLQLGKVLSDAMRFMDVAAGEEISFRHPAGYELHATDICEAFARASGVECGSAGYHTAIAALAVANGEAPSSSDLSRLTEENAALRAERDRLKEALKPFAEAAAGWDPEERDGFEFSDATSINLVAYRICVGHLRAARQALTPSEEPPHDR